MIGDRPFKVDPRRDNGKESQGKTADRNVESMNSRQPCSEQEVNALGQERRASETDAKEQQMDCHGPFDVTAAV